MYNKQTYNKKIKKLYNFKNKEYNVRHFIEKYLLNE